MKQGTSPPDQFLSLLTSLQSHRRPDLSRGESLANLVSSCKPKTSSLPPTCQVGA